MKPGPGRPPSWIWLRFIPNVKQFIPVPCLNPAPIILNYAELNALRLIDLDDKKQEEAAKLMKTSKATVWRLVQSGRKKIVRAIVECRPIVIEVAGELKKG